jgi:branched-chain amino acid transport system ATP-binding protein
LTPALSITGLSVRFGALRAVDDVSLDVPEGQVLGICGPNGAGKTTLMDAVTGFVPVAAGEVRLGGRAITGLRPHRIAREGLLRTFQLNAGFDRMSVFDNVLAAALFARPAGRAFLPFARRADHDAARRAMDRVGLGGAGAEARGLPVLDRKRLMLAQALVADPQVLLLDEPVGGLTPGETDSFAALLSGLRAEGLTLILIEHVLPFLIGVSDRAVVMAQGKVIYDGAPAPLTSDPAVVAAYLGQGRAAA